jgi:4-amino-4-deoxy-L-arabinose transferase-like glycosyltransferase
LSNRLALRTHWPILLLLAAYITLAVFFSLTIPLSKAPDEYVHFLYVRFLVEHKRPPINLEEQTGAGYKSDQPPLYYALVALLTAPVDVSEPPSFKFSWEPATRQLIDIVLSHTLLITTADETWPLKGLFLAWFVGRGVSILLSSLTILVTYLIALEIFPRQRWLALVTAGTLAFIPRFLFIGSVLSDDNMVGLVMALFFYAIVKLVKSRGSSWPIFALVGFLLGLALSIKYTVLPVPLEVLVLTLWLAWQQRWRPVTVLTRLAVFGLALALAAAPWFGFMWWHFNQIREYGLIMGLIKPIMAGGNNPTETAAILTTVSGGGIASRFPEGNLWDWARFLFAQFWEVPIAGALPPYPVPLVLGLAVLLCLLAVFGWWRRWRRNESGLRVWFGVLALHVLIFVPIPLVRFIAIGDIHDTAQARHLLFPAAPAIALLLAAGVVAAAPKKGEKLAGLAVAGLLLVFSLAHLYYYFTGFPNPLPVRTDPALAAIPDTPLSVNFANGLNLRGYDWQLTNRQVLELNLHWRSTAVTQVDDRTEITLRHPHGDVLLRWLSQPAAGRFPTRAWDVGDSVRDTLQIPLVDLPPGEYEVKLRLLDWDDLPLSSEQGDAVSLFNFDLNQSSASPTPALWQNGEIARHPTYRYRAAIPLTGVGGQKTILIDEQGQPHSPLSVTDGLTLFLVDYDWPTGNYRLQLDGLETDLRLRVENFDWNFSPPAVMFPLEANFNSEIRLIGYDLPGRRVKAGDGIPLVLYWQSLRRMTNSYIIFDRLLDAGRQVWGGYDRLPKETYPTNLWVPGEIVVDGFAVPVDPATPDGIYNIVVGLYDQVDPAAKSLPLVQDGSPLETSSVVIGPVKVGGPPPAAVLAEDALSPAQSLSVELGDPPVIRLRGYDLTQTGESVQLKLYWQSLAQTPINWTVFVHLRNEAGEAIAQADAPPAAGKYPTSLWDSGEIIPDTFTLNLPPEIEPGTYHLVVGLYNPFTFERLPVAGSDDNSITLSNVVVR